MQVGPGGGTGGAHGTHPLALFHPLASPDVDAAEVCEQGGFVVPVADFDHVAIATLPPRKTDQTVADGANRRATGCGVVHAQVGFLLAGKGVEAHAVAAAHAGELQRGA
ncbi:hypothetical protein D9M69_666600 [compost metagenome]